MTCGVSGQRSHLNRRAFEDLSLAQDPADVTGVASACVINPLGRRQAEQHHIHPLLAAL